MLILLPIFLLILTSIVLAVLRVFRRRSGVSWLVSAILALLVWLMIMFLRLRIPDMLLIGSVKTIINFPFHYVLLLDRISWPYAWALSTALAGLFLSMAPQLTTSNTSKPEWVFWSINLLLGGFGLVSIFSGNLNTLILSWAAIDLIWLYYMLVNSYNHRAVLIMFAFRVSGLFLAISASYSRAPEQAIYFPVVNPKVNTFLLLAALLRLVSIGWSGRLIDKSFQNQTVSPFFNILISSTALIIITRSSTALNPNLIPLMAGFLALVALTCGIGSILANTRNDLPLWSIGIAALATFATLQSQTQASLAWGLVIILLGSYLQFNVTELRFTRILSIIAMIGISTFPFTQSWQAVGIYPMPSEMFKHGFIWIFFLLAQTMLVASFVKSSLQSGQPIFGAERWVWVIYPLGLLILIFTQVFILLFGIPGITNDLFAFPPLALSWASLAVVVLGGFGFWFSRRIPQRSKGLQSQLNQIMPYEMAYQAIRSLFRSVALLIHFIERTFEGEGGILWTILFLVLLLAIFIEFRFGV